MEADERFFSGMRFDLSKPWDRAADAVREELRKMDPDIDRNIFLQQIGTSVAEMKLRMYDRARLTEDQVEELRAMALEDTLDNGGAL